MTEAIPSANFGFLAVLDRQLVRLRALAERYFADDPSTRLIKLREFGETPAQLVAAKSDLFREAQEAQADLLRPPQVRPRHSARGRGPLSPPARRRQQGKPELAITSQRAPASTVLTCPRIGQFDRLRECHRRRLWPAA